MMRCEKYGEFGNAWNLPHRFAFMPLLRELKQFHVGRLGTSALTAP